MEFRRDINGLRAVAVIAVVLFHFNQNWMPGGFAGVDVFFVISGFLMTGIIFRGIEDNSFSILKFYHSRAKRILPALSAICLFSVVYGYFLLYDHEFLDTIRQSISATTFLSNFYFWKTFSYFSLGAESKILLHTWSLSIEWQFYIIYPLILYFLSKVINLQNLKWVILLGFTASFIISVFASPKWATSSYYLLPTRGWEMTLGGLAYFSRIKISELKLRFLSNIGLVLILVSYLIISEDNVWPGYLAFIPAFGTFLILFGNSDLSILRHKSFQVIGKYSYSIYLWHWLAVFMANRYTDMSLLVTIAGVGFSLLLGFLSYEAIEKKGFNRVNKIFVLLSILLPCTLLYFFETIIEHRKISNTENNKLVEYYQNQYKNSSPWIYNLCEEGKACEQGGVFLWGDSHAHALHYGLENSKLANFSSVTTSTCAPSVTYPNYIISSRITCNKNNKIALEQVKFKNPDIVILATRHLHEETNWDLIALKLKELGAKKIVVLGPVPQFKGPLPLLVAKKYMHDDTISRVDMDESIFQSNEKMNSLASDNYLYVDVLSEFCSNDGCFFQTERKNHKKLISFDYGHLSTEGSAFVVNELLIKKM